LHDYLVRPAAGRKLIEARGLSSEVMERTGPGPDREDFGEASLGDAQSANPPDDPEMIDPDADPLDTDVEDADLFLGTGEDEDENES
jgi:hypothetical protein